MAADLPRKIIECLVKLDARRDELTADNPPTDGTRQQELSDAVDDLKSLIGSAAVPTPLKRMTLLRWREEKLPEGGRIGYPDAEAWRALVLQMAGEARTELEALQACASDAVFTRPPKPTSVYCLLKGYRVRWDGETTLQPRFWRILEYLLSRGDYPLPISDLCDAVWREKLITSKTVTNTISDLNKALLAVSFPWEWRISNGHIYREG